MEHPFAQYIRILGRGKRGARSLTLAEATTAFDLILRNEVEREQIGAFLMLLRMKEETADELAGFVTAARVNLRLPAAKPAPQLDWPCYAGKRRQLPWFLLAALLLARHGTKVLMHGVGSRDDGRIYLPAALASMELKPCDSMASAYTQLQSSNFAYISIEDLAPRVAHLLALRDLFGLRSTVNSVCRMLNPLGAPFMLQGIFHPGYDVIHRDAALILNQAHCAVIKGDGGEIERNPDGPCPVLSVVNGKTHDEIWPAQFQQRHMKDPAMETTDLAAVWRGEKRHEYGEAAVIGTTAIAIKLLELAPTQTAAMNLAQSWWNSRL